MRKIEEKSSPWENGLLNGKTAHEYIEQRLARMEDSDVCAMFMIDLYNPAEAGKRPGKDEEREIEKQAGEILSSMFYASDIVSRTGCGEYLIFTVWRAGRKEAEDKAARLCKALNISTKADALADVGASVGVYMAEGNGLTFEGVFGQAAAALYKAKSSGQKNYCVLTNESEVMNKKNGDRSKAVNAIPMNTLLKYLDGGAGLIEVDGKEPRLIYVSQGFYRMQGLPSDAYHLPCTLRKTGIHPDYMADYVQFLRECADRDEVSEHIHKISGNGKEWIWRHVRVARVAYPASRNPVLLELSTDISRLIETEDQLRESNDRLSVAFRQTPNVLWEVNIGARTYNIFNVDEQKCSPDTVIKDFPESFLERGIIHPESASDFRAFADDLMRGKNGGTGNFIMKDPARDCYGWVSLSYRMVADSEGTPLKAIGIQSKLPDISGIGPGLFPRRPLPEVLRHNLIVRLKVNVTSDYIDEIWIAGSDHTAWTWGKSYTEIMEKEGIQGIRLFTESEKRRLRERFDRQRLLEAYEKGDLWSSAEYRRVDDGGAVQWISDAVNLVRDPKTQSVYMFACFSECQKRHEWESRIENGISRDPWTGLYDYTTAKQISSCLIENGESRQCALSLIRFVGGSDEEIEKRSGKASDIRRFIAIALSLSLGTECITGQYRPDMVYAFFPDVGTRFDVKRRIEDAFAYVRVSMEGMPELDRIRFVAGTVTEQSDETDCEMLLFRAGYLCEMWKNSAMDTVVFPSEDEDWAWTGLRKENKEGITVRESELERPLTKEEQKAAFQCVTEMLKSVSLEASLINALHSIGSYYKAARVYILALSDDGQTVTMQQEWTEWGKQSIRYVMSGVQIGQIPLLKKCMEKELPIYTENRSSAADGDYRSSGWNFTVCPMKKKDEITGFLCVENAKKHSSEAALLNTLIPYIVGEQKRFDILADRKNNTGHDALTMLPNLSSYMDVVYSLDSDVYSSMGALSLDVPDFSSINSSFGFEYGRKMLLYISETLLTIFGNAYIFRTWDAEFVVLFPNTIQEVFNGRCARLRTMIQRRYPRQVRIGSVWSEGIFSAKNLVREAQAIMRSENVDGRCGKSLHPTEYGSGEDKQSGFLRQQFVAFFQPKVDMRDGQLAGAEALVRGIDKDGNIISPGQFIETLEKDGSIRDLDLFMLDQVLRQLSDWQAKGLPLIKVSVNMSRITLFHPTVLASVLAIQSRYPNIPADQIELEITETAGDMEKASLSCIVDNFRECGVNFELDDFGSGYANISVFSNIKFNTIKLDRSLVNDIPGNAISCMLVENITQICRNFGMQCIAEGVETQQQEQALLKAGCIYGQGFYYAKPLSATDFEERYLKTRIACAERK